MINQIDLVIPTRILICPFSNRLTSWVYRTIRFSINAIRFFF